MDRQQPKKTYFPQHISTKSVLVFLCFMLLWQMFVGYGQGIFLTIIAFFLVWKFGHQLEQQHVQIKQLQHQVFELQKQSQWFAKTHSSQPSMSSDSENSDHTPFAAPQPISQEFDPQSQPYNLVQQNYKNDGDDKRINQKMPPLPQQKQTIASDHDQIEEHDLSQNIVISSTNSSSASSIPTWQTHATESISRQHNNQEQPFASSLIETAVQWFKGGNSIVRVAIIVLLIGVVMLLRFASEVWQLTLTAKMAAIAAGGLGLTGVGFFLRQKRFEYAISLQGAGLGIVFLVLFSSFHLGVIQSVSMAYVVLIGLLGLTLLLAIRQNALFLAFVALGSGFIAPFILNTGDHNIPALMAYLFVLNLALAVIAWFKPWRILNTVALLMTFGIGGFAVWANAQPEQYTEISLWVWVIFALYLFISIRYSHLIVQYKTKFRDVALVDTTLIFATPFMAFSLYAGLVNSDGYALSIASAVLAIVYVLIGYTLHRRVEHLSILTQCFYGLGLVFTALVLPFAFNANWTSVGWTIQGVAMILLGWRYTLSNARYFGTVLLIASLATILKSIIFDEQAAVLSATILMISYVVAAYCLIYPYVSEHSQNPLPTSKALIPKSLEALMGYAFVVISIFALAPYVYHRLFATHMFYSVQETPALYESGFAILAWFMFIMAVYAFKERRMTALLKFDQPWRLLTPWVLGLSVFLVLSGFDILLYYSQSILALDGGAPSIHFKIIFLCSAVLWWTCFVIYVSYIQPITALSNTRLKFNHRHVLHDILITVAIIFAAIAGSIALPESLLKYGVVLLPLLIFAGSLLIKKMTFLKSLWIGNVGIILLASLWLWWILWYDNGQWSVSLPYVPFFNPMDITNLLTFGVLVLAVQPYLQHTKRELQIPSAALLLVTGLMLISSLMLRTLHQYAEVAYWSLSAWNDNTLQTSLTILWATTALILTSLASRKAWRYIWMLGIAVLVIVIVKLIFLDLSHSHTLTRIVSFIGSGLIMLVIGYFAPLPPAQNKTQ